MPFNVIYYSTGYFVLIDAISGAIASPKLYSPQDVGNFMVEYWKKKGQTPPPDVYDRWFRTALEAKSNPNVETPIVPGSGEPMPTPARGREDYYERVEEKRERYQNIARNAAKASDIYYKSARAKADIIPLGQPLLTDHYSYKSDLHTRERIQNQFRKSIEEQKKSEYYANKAENYMAGKITSDNPEAIHLLEERLRRLQDMQERMKKANQYVRANNIQGLKEMGFTDKQIADLLKGDELGRKGFPDFELTNNNNNMRRIKQRIEELKAMGNRTPVKVENQNFTYTENTNENRVMFKFPGIPPEEVRNVLKTNGFRWTPSIKAWTRLLNPAGIFAANNVKKRLDEIYGTQTEKIPSVRPIPKEILPEGWEETANGIWQKNVPGYVLDIQLNDGKYYYTVLDNEKSRRYISNTPYATLMEAMQAATTEMAHQAHSDTVTSASSSSGVPNAILIGNMDQVISDIEQFIRAERNYVDYVVYQYGVRFPDEKNDPHMRNLESRRQLEYSGTMGQLIEIFNRYINTLKNGGTIPADRAIENTQIAIANINLILENLYYPSTPRYKAIANAKAHLETLLRYLQQLNQPPKPPVAEEYKPVFVGRQGKLF